jgi:hypothetical protein
VALHPPLQEKRLISRFFDEISQDTGKFVFSVKDTLACLEMGAVEILIVWENLDCDRSVAAVDAVASQQGSCHSLMLLRLAVIIDVLPQLMYCLLPGPVILPWWPWSQG